MIEYPFEPPVLTADGDRYMRFEAGEALHDLLNSLFMM